MITRYKLTPATNLPDTSQWFITCNLRDMQPYACDSALRSDFWEAFECAVQNAIKQGDRSIEIVWNYRQVKRPIRRVWKLGMTYAEYLTTGDTDGPTERQNSDHYVERQFKNETYTLKPVDKGLQRLYNYPETLSARDAYSTAWHLARLSRYQGTVLGVRKAYNLYKSACAGFGIPLDLANLTRSQLYNRDN